MNLGLTLAPVMRLEHRIEHKLAVKMELRLEILRAMGVMDLKPKGKCPHCTHILTPGEILDGFTDDPLDTTTFCPKCECRFQPLLHRYIDSASEYQIMFMCPVQCMHQLKPMVELDEKSIRDEAPAVYYSALAHFGSLKSAFESEELKYKGMTSWKDKVRPLLGDFPDRALAEVVGVSRSSVQGLRSRLGITAHG